jgi:nitrate reductase assembly molybdenum cofactor insertion protein NarJ
LWDELLHKSDKMKEAIDKFAAQLGNTNALQKIVQVAKEKELNQMKEEYTSVLERERVILTDFPALMDSAKRMSEELRAQDIPTIIYWNDVEGEHCIATKEEVSYA